MRKVNLGIRVEGGGGSGDSLMIIIVDGLFVDTVSAQPWKLAQGLHTVVPHNITS